MKKTLLFSLVLLLASFNSNAWRVISYPCGTTTCHQLSQGDCTGFVPLPGVTCENVRPIHGGHDGKKIYQNEIVSIIIYGGGGVYLNNGDNEYLLLNVTDYYPGDFSYGIAVESFTDNNVNIRISKEIFDWDNVTAKVLEEQVVSVNLSNLKKLIITPNPSSGEAKVSENGVELHSGIVSVDFYNKEFVLIRSFANIQESNYRFSVSGLNNDTYYYVIHYNGSSTNSGKLIVNK